MKPKPLVALNHFTVPFAIIGILSDTSFPKGRRQRTSTHPNSLTPRSSTRRHATRGTWEIVVSSCASLIARAGRTGQLQTPSALFRQKGVDDLAGLVGGPVRAAFQP